MGLLHVELGSASDGRWVPVETGLGSGALLTVVCGGEFGESRRQYRRETVCR